MLFNNEAEELLFIANDDLDSAKILATHHKPKNEISCYLCHQCAEKALKSYLSFHGIKFKFIHNLEQLCIDCQIIDQSFVLLTNECDTLNKYITLTRYSRKYDLTEFHMRQAIIHAEKILDFVKERTTCQSTD